MKLLFKKTKEQRMVANFKGNPIDAVETIIHSMNKSKVIERIIMTAAIAHQELGGELDGEVENFEIKKKTNSQKLTTKKQ